MGKRNESLGGKRVAFENLDVEDRFAMGVTQGARKAGEEACGGVGGDVVGGEVVC